MKKTFLSMMLVFVLLVSQSTALAFAKTEGEITVNDWNQFVKALESNQYDTINLGASIKSERLPKDTPLILGKSGKEITINGNHHQITLNEAGILLGGDVTFNETNIVFLNPVRNAIIANGHSLTLNSVTSTKSTFPIHVFAGSLTGYKEEIPKSGENGTITISGVSQIAKVFAGSLAEGNNAADTQNNEYTGNTSITINATEESKIKGIYAHGAREPRGIQEDGKPHGDDMFGDADKYKVNGEVTINLYGSVVESVFGKTGGARDAKLVYNKDGKGNPTNNLVAKDIGELVVQSGKLTPNVGSSLSPNSNITIEHPLGQLSMVNYGNPTINDFNSKGCLVLGQEQHLTITGNVTSKTKLGIGLSLGDISRDEPKVGHTYITAVHSNPGDFTLLHSYNKNVNLNKKEDGRWVVEEGSGNTQEKTELTSYDIREKKKTISKADYINYQGVDFDVDCTFKDPTGSLDQVIMKYTIKYESMLPLKIESHNGVAGLRNLNLQISQQGDENGAEKILSIERLDTAQSVYAGNYTIDIETEVNGQPMKKTITLQITEGGETQPEKHVHQWEYSAQGTTIIANCKGKGNCDVTGKQAILELVAPIDLQFDGNSKHATIKGNIPDVENPKIIYSLDGQLIDADPTDVGNYVASMSLGGKTANVPFIITKAKEKDLGQLNVMIKANEQSITIPNIGRGMPENAKIESYILGTPTGNTVTQVRDVQVVDGTLKATIVNGKAGEKITFPVTITSKNYNDSMVNVVVTLADKEKVNIDVTNVTFNKEEYDCQGHAGYSGNPIVENNIVPIDQLDKVYEGTMANGDNYHEVNIEPTQAGDYTVTFKIPDDNEVYLGQSDSVAFSINKKELQWDTSNLVGEKVYDGKIDAPKLEGELKTDGILAADISEVRFRYSEIKTPTLTSADVGEYTLQVNVDNPHLEGEKAHNYLLPQSSPEVTVRVIQAKGSGTVKINNWTVGDQIPVPEVITTNDSGKVQYEYKRKEEPETAYKNFIEFPPNSAGIYVLKATFEATLNYTKAIATTEFTVTETQMSKQFQVDLSAEPLEGGTVKGSGRFDENKNITVEAIPNEGYKFLCWKEKNHEIKNASAVYSFNLVKDRNLVAVFEKETTLPLEKNKIEKNELTKVPETITQYKTIDELKQAMVKITEQGGYSGKHMKFYDVKLKLTKDNGKTWYDATENDFPVEGIVVEFPYKDMGKGIGKDTHDFYVTHMYSITSERLGTVAGEIEVPSVTKLEDRIRVTLKGLSPVSVSWRTIENQGATDSTNHGTGAVKPGKDTTVKHEKNSASNKENSKLLPKTGDQSDVLYVIFIMILSVIACVSLSYIRIKKWIEKANR